MIIFLYISFCKIIFILFSFVLILLLFFIKLGFKQKNVEFEIVNFFVLLIEEVLSMDLFFC